MFSFSEILRDKLSVARQIVLPYFVIIIPFCNNCHTLQYLAYFVTLLTLLINRKGCPICNNTCPALYYIKSPSLGDKHRIEGQYLRNVIPSKKLESRNSNLNFSFTTLVSLRYLLKDTHREKVPSIKTLALTKSMNMEIWLAGLSNQIFIKRTYTETKFSKKQSSYWHNSFLPFVIVPFCTPHSICHNIGFWQGCFVWKYCIFNFSTFN